MTLPARELICAVEPALPVAEFRRVLVESGLGSTRPVDDIPRLQAMLDGADLLLTAPSADAQRQLLGVLRAIDDGAWCCFVIELAVCVAAQRLGVGSALLNAARGHVGPQVSLVLHALPDAAAFYERVGMARVQDAFWFRRQR